MQVAPGAPSSTDAAPARDARWPYADEPAALRRWIERLVRGRVPDDDVEDVVQTVLCHAIARPGAPAARDEQRRLVAGIAAHKVADRLRSMYRDRRQLDALARFAAAAAVGGAADRGLVPTSPGGPPASTTSKAVRLIDRFCAQAGLYDRDRIDDLDNLLLDLAATGAPRASLAEVSGRRMAETVKHLYNRGFAVTGDVDGDRRRGRATTADRRRHRGAVELRRELEREHLDAGDLRAALREVRVLAEVPRLFRHVLAAMARMLRTLERSCEIDLVDIVRRDRSVAVDDALLGRFRAQHELMMLGAMQERQLVAAGALYFYRSEARGDLTDGELTDLADTDCIEERLRRGVDHARRPDGGFTAIAAHAQATRAFERIDLAHFRRQLDAQRPFTLPWYSAGYALINQDPFNAALYADVVAPFRDRGPEYWSYRFNLLIAPTIRDDPDRRVELMTELGLPGLVELARTSGDPIALAATDSVAVVAARSLPALRRDAAR